MQKKQSATIYDVANRVGVSLATVSRVVNGNTNVRESTKQKVLAAIEELGYQPNAVARGLASKKTTTIGVVMPDVTDMYYAELARGIDDIANMYHYDVLLTNTDEDPIREAMAVNNLAAKQVDGIIFMGNALDNEVLKTFDRIDAPVVLAGSLDEKAVTPSVNIDYHVAMQEAVSTLLTNGHEKIALVLGDMSYAINSQQRLKGYTDALRKANHDFDDSLVFSTRKGYTDGLKVAERVAQSGATAAVVFDDEVAVAILNYQRDRGVSVPDDFEIITSNNSKVAQIARPAMTSVAQPIYDLGAVAMRMLTKLMNHEVIGETQVRLPHHFEWRGTTR
jgi:LacI family transcriptional regulator